VQNRAGLNIKMVIGMGDIIDGGGYPVDKYGNVNGTCSTVPPSTWQTQWQQAQAAVKILTSHGIYYQPTIGNHDYDCEGDRPQPRSATNYFHYFGPPTINPTGYIFGFIRAPHSELLQDHEDGFNQLHGFVSGAFPQKFDLGGGEPTYFEFFRASNRGHTCLSFK
jgi:hypothetical protein